MQCQLLVNGQVLGRYGDAQPTLQAGAPGSGDTSGTTHTAEFNLAAPVLRSGSAGSQSVSYTVVGGETLKDVARTVLGDASLWWRIADANGLSRDAEPFPPCVERAPLLRRSKNQGFTLYSHH